LRFATVLDVGARNDERVLSRRGQPKKSKIFLIQEKHFRRGAFLSSLSWQSFSAVFLSRLSQQSFAAVVISMGPFSAVFLSHHRRSGLVVSCCHHLAVVKGWWSAIHIILLRWWSAIDIMLRRWSAIDIILLWSGVGGQLLTLTGSLKEP